jgi:uncharacterized coiled-coil DUF342 family protein
MIRFFQWFNFLGICALAVLCGLQWRENRRVNLEAIGLEKTRLAQVAQLADRDKAIKGYLADLDELHQRLTISEAALKETEMKLTAVTLERNRLTTERNQLAAQRDQLKANLDQWIAAVTARDAALKKAGEELQKIATERNDAVLKFNELAGKYNAIVKDLNGTKAK